jgi:hypothetical protein
MDKMSRPKSSGKLFTELQQNSRLVLRTHAVECAELMPFIVSTTGKKPASKDMKLIRSHVMRGKNSGQGRRDKGKSKNGLEEEPDAMLAGTLKQSRVLIMKAYSIPSKVGTDLSLVHFADTIDPATVARILDCKSTLRGRNRALFLCWYSQCLLSLDLVYSYGKRMMYNLEESINMDIDASLLVHPLIVDSLYLHSQAFTTLSLAQSVRRKGQRASPALLLHHSRTLQLLNERLKLEGASKFSTPTSVVILSLITHAQAAGDLEIAQSHLSGLQSVAELRGGLVPLVNHEHIVMEIIRYVAVSNADSYFLLSFLINFFWV